MVIFMIDWHDIIKRCRQHHPEAQHLLYDYWKARLMGVCRRYTASREEAQDVLQEAFIRIFTRLHQLDSVEKLEGWLIRVTVRVALNYYQSNKRHLYSNLEIREQDNGEYELILSDVSDAYLVQMLNELPDGCRHIFNLYIIEGYSHTEIAEMLNITEATSRSQLHYAKRLLKEKLRSAGIMRYERYA